MMADDRIETLTPESVPDPQDTEAGFVLVSVIWIAGLLAVVATAFAIVVRSHTLGGSNVVYSTRAESAADGMTLAAALRLATFAEGTGALKLNGEPALCQWPGEIAVAVSIQDQGGLVDLNTASPDLLSALLRGLGEGDTGSAEIVAAVQDYRDADGQSASGGDEPSVFPGKSYGPAALLVDWAVQPDP